MRRLDDTEYRVVCEYLEKHLWIAKERNDRVAIMELNRVLEAFDGMVDVLSMEEDEDE